MIRFKPWPGIIFVLLGLNVIIVAITVVAAIRSDSPFEPDHHSSGVEWDSIKSLRAPRPAWSMKVEPVAEGFRVSLFDDRGEPVRDSIRVAVRSEGDAEAKIEPLGRGQHLIRGLDPNAGFCLTLSDSERELAMLVYEGGDKQP